MRDMLNILDAKVYAIQNFYDMWDSVERDDFEDAMNCQFQYLNWTDRFETLVAELDPVDRAFLEKLADIANNGK